MSLYNNYTTGTQSSQTFDCVKYFTIEFLTLAEQTTFRVCRRYPHASMMPSFIVSSHHVAHLCYNTVAGRRIEYAKANRKRNENTLPS